MIDYYKNRQKVKNVMIRPEIGGELMTLPTNRLSDGTNFQCNEEGLVETPTFKSKAKMVKIKKIKKKQKIKSKKDKSMSRIFITPIIKLDSRVIYH